MGAEGACVGGGGYQECSGEKHTCFHLTFQSFKLVSLVGVPRTSLSFRGVWGWMFNGEKPLSSPGVPLYAVCFFLFFLTGVHTHPVRVVLQDPAALGVELVVARSGAGRLVLPARRLETLVTAGETEREAHVKVSGLDRQVHSAPSFLKSTCI